MTTVKEIFDFLDSIAPVTLAESYDNPGILAGSPEMNVDSVLLSLDITPETVKEASDKGARLIISHHPVIFRPVKALLDRGPTKVLWDLAGKGISAVCMHTNLDTANGGVNDALAEKLELHDIGILAKSKTEHYKKIVMFVPKGHEEKVRLAMARAGAGKLGCYDSCSFSSYGVGRFRPLDGARPFIGERGKTEETDEVRIEAICRADLLSDVISAALENHPYETPAYDIFDDEGASVEYGMGRTGTLEKACGVREFAEFVRKKLSCAGVRVCSSGKPVYRVALCSGAAAGELLDAAQRLGADTFVTGEMKHSLYYEARALGINVVEAGHFATETVVLPPLMKKLKDRFPQVSFSISEENREPYYMV